MNDLGATDALIDDISFYLIKVYRNSEGKITKESVGSKLNKRLGTFPDSIATQAVAAVHILIDFASKDVIKQLLKQFSDKKDDLSPHEKLLRAADKNKLFGSKLTVNSFDMAKPIDFNEYANDIQLYLCDDYGDASSAVSANIPNASSGENSDMMMLIARINSIGSPDLCDALLAILKSDRSSDAIQAEVHFKKLNNILLKRTKSDT